MKFLEIPSLVIKLPQDREVCVGVGNLIDEKKTPTLYVGMSRPSDGLLASSTWEHEGRVHVSIALSREAAEALAWLLWEQAPKIPYTLSDGENELKGNQ